MFEIPTPYHLFLGESTDWMDIKIAKGLIQWRPEVCLSEQGLEGCTESVGLPARSVAQAAAEGARTLVLATVNAGGTLPAAWLDVLRDAAAAGLDIASGMHQPLASLPGLKEAAARGGARLWDVRLPQGRFPVGTGARRSGRRVLTVGTDCGVGKMYTALAIERELRERAVEAEFKATGQTGILIAGGGVPVDAVVADFIAGAIEELSPPVEPHRWHVIEGQGSLHHPAFAGVTLGLIHGAQPDVLVVCDQPGRVSMRHGPHHRPPSLERTLAAALEAASLTNPDVRAAGFSLNTSQLEEETARRLLDDVEQRLELPATDPVRYGIGRVVDRLLVEAPLKKGARER